jgi:dihydrofolate synthase/folylpolyglutamate synthase
MNYKDSVKYIHSLLKFGMNLGLQRISALLNELGNPQEKLEFVHVAGTNGKGTTSTMLSSILCAAGKKTGLFTSPYVFDFCERIQINNKNIPHDDLSRVVEKVKNACDRLSAKGTEPTEFEAITAAAMLYFYEQKCDAVVLEVGLGGRYDSTNIIPCPKAAVITSISLDHTKILGDTVEKIAAEKCGIIKNGGTVITTSEQNEKALSVIKDTVKEKNGRLLIGDVSAAEILSEDIFGTEISYNGLTVKIPLVGRHQVENTVGVITAARALGISDEFIKKGIESTVIHARMEIISRSPVIMLDGGHNPECAAALENVLVRFAGDKNITVLIGMMADKDTKDYLAAILPHCKTAVFTKPSNPRAEDENVLLREGKCFCRDVVSVKDPKDAYKKAESLVKNGDMLLVCGSFYLLSDIFGEP